LNKEIPLRAEPLCILRDCTREYVTEDGFLPPVPGAIFSVAELVDYLHAAARRRPHALRMDLPDDYRAWIHIGGPLGAIHLSRVYLRQPMPANPPSAWIAMPDRPLPPSTFVSFLNEGSQAEDDIGGDQLLPVEEVIRIATYLAEHRALPATHGWVRYHGNGSCTYLAKTPAPAAGQAPVPTVAAEPFSARGETLYDDDSYLRAIRAHPDDRQLRRLYADWLGAFEPRRTELIRVCEAMRDVSVWSDRYWELKARRNELWEQCPLDWLEATGYDGGYYDPVFRDGVPDGCRERWRLIREFTERWHGISVPDVGGQRAKIAQVEEQLGVELPASLREYVAYIHDLADSSLPHDPRRYNTLFHSAYSVIHLLSRYPAVSLIHFTLDSSVLGIARADLTTADPPTYCFDEVVDENGVSYSPPSSRSPRPPTLFAPSLSLSIFRNLFIQLPTAGDMEARGADLDDWLPRLAFDFPIHARFDDTHIFETNELLVLISRRGNDHLVEAIVRRHIPAESVPGYLFGGTGENIGSAGMLTPERYRRKQDARPLLDAVPQPECWDRVPDPAHFDLQTYRAWVRYSGFYPLWLSILRRREAERDAAKRDGGPGVGPPPQRDLSPSQGNDDIPF
jgi:uncharacterized protein (TIGR02996 family)